MHNCSQLKEICIQRTKDICNNKTMFVVHSMADGKRLHLDNYSSMEESEDNFQQLMDMKIVQMNNDCRVVHFVVAWRVDNFQLLQLFLGCEQFQQALASDSN